MLDTLEWRFALGRGETTGSLHRLPVVSRGARHYVAFCKRSGYRIGNVKDPRLYDRYLFKLVKLERLLIP